MNKRNRNYVVFAIATTVIALLGAFFVVFFGLNSPDSIDGYPKYSYSEYVDHSKDKKLVQQDGAQIYEAEDCFLNYGVRVTESVSSSNHEAVVSIRKDSSLVLKVFSDSNTNAKLTLSLSYTSVNHKETEANKIIAISLNSERMSLNGVKIESCYNELEYLENGICRLSLQKGRNTIELAFVTDDEIYLDYFLLTTNTQKRKENDTFSKRHWFYFYSKEDRQCFEAELAEKEQAISVKDEKAVNGYSRYLAEEGDRIAFPIMGDIQTSSKCALLRKKGTRNNKSTLRIRLNGKEVYEDSFRLDNDYNLIDIGAFTFRKGENYFTIENKGYPIYLDALIVNSDINFSNRKRNYDYQAEEAYINGGEIRTSENARNDQYVAMNIPSSSLTFEIESLRSATSYGVLRRGYKGEGRRNLSNIMDIRLNGTSLSLSDSMVSVSSSLEVFQNVGIGQLSIRRGLNILQVTSNQVNYSLDALILTDFERTARNQGRVEAEQVLCSRPNALTFGLNSQGGLSQLLKVDDSLTFYFHSHQRLSLNISLVLSLKDDIDLTTVEEFGLSVNGKEAAILDSEIPYGTRQNFFTTINLGNVSIQAGINVLALKCFSVPILVDSLVFSW